MRALVLGAAITATAEKTASAMTLHGLKAPEEVGGFRLNDTVNFERTKPGEGYGLDYSLPGWKLDVVIYDLKRIAIPSDPKSAIVRAEFERAREDAFLPHPRGFYVRVYLRRNFTVEDQARRTRFQCSAFYLTRDGAKPQDGYLCVTSWNNKFVKFRLTTLRDRANEAMARRHMMTWIPVLWSGVNAKAGQAVDPKPRRRGPPPRVRRASPCPAGYICR